MSNCEDIIIEVPTEQIVIEMTPEGADGADGNGIQSIELLSTAGLVKTYRILFTDGQHFDYEVTDGAKGEQGPQGAQGPQGEQGEQGETGNGIESVSLLSTSGLQKTYRILFTDGSHFDYVVTDGADGQTPTLEWGNISGTLSAQTDLQNALNNKADIIATTASGSMVNITDSGAFPVVNLTVSIEPDQSGSGDPSLTNVRPISGWTGVTVSHSGVDTTTPDTLTVTFPTEAGTVYGGTLDVTNGVLTVDRGILTDFSGLTANGMSTTGAYRYKINLAGIAHYIVKEAISDRLKYNVKFNANAGDFYNAENVINIFLADSTVTDAIATLTGGQIVYPLATPITYQLTPQQLSLLKGDNTLWADTGDVSIDYRADTKLYIQQLTKPTEDDMTANANISSGQFFMVGNSLYLASQAISAGETIVPGTNCTALSLADALNQLNQ